MAEFDDLDELRALQARAYGRSGRLDARDEARLEELIAKRARVPPAVAEEDAPPTVGDDASEAAQVVRRARPEEGGSSKADRNAATSRFASSRARWIAIGIGLVVVFGLGGVAGWMLTRPAEQIVELSPAQAQWQQALIDSGEYDAGSIQAMAVEDGMVIWAATRSRGLSTCLVLGDAEERVPSCTSTDYVRSSGFEAVRTVDADGDLKRQVSAQVFLTLDGRPAVVSGSFLYPPDDELGAPYRDESEAAIAEDLVEMGLERSSIRIAGYDRETPVWTGMWATTGQTCLIYDGSQEEPLIVCEPIESVGTGAVSLGLERPDEETGGRTSIMFSYGDNPSYLQITREPAPGGAE